MEYNLSKNDAKNIRTIAVNLQLKYKTVDNPKFHKTAYHHAFELPKELLVAIAKFDAQDNPFIHVKGLSVNNDLLMATPASWREERSTEAYLCEFMHYLISMHVGQPFCWKTQQNGRTINDILPVKGFEQEQLAIASRSNLLWHVEDAFHDARGEFLSLMCLRNNDNIPTLVSAPDLSKLSRSSLIELMKPQFHVRADDAHDEDMNLNDAGQDEALIAAFGSARNLRSVAILFGNSNRPYLRLDMDTFGREEFVSEAAETAYNELCHLVESSAIDIVCKSGDVLLVNNFRTIHGRPPFEPRYDGTDRWLQRLLVNSDFRKTASYRETVDSNVLFA